MTSSGSSSMMQSMPWMLKAVLLGSNLYAQARGSSREDTMSTSQASETTVQRIIMSVVAFEFVLMLSSVMPSLMFSVQQRKNTTTNICFQILYHVNTYILLCFLFREKYMMSLLPIAVQFLYVHLHYWQARMLARNNRLLLYGKAFSVVHGIGMGVVPLLFLSVVRLPVNTGHSSTQHTFLMWLLVVFVPEIMSTCTSMVNMMLGVCAEMYESALEAW